MKTKQLQNSPACDIIQIKDGWLMCPNCNQFKLLRLLPSTTAQDLLVYCRRCHTESLVNIPPERQRL